MGGARRRRVRKSLMCAVQLQSARAMALKLVLLPFLFPLLFAVKPVQSQGIYELAVIIIVLCTSINYGLQDEATFFDDLLHK